MTTTAWAFAALTACFAVADWTGVIRGNRRVRWVAKPATLASLIAVAVTLEPVDPGIRTVMVVGLVLSLVGDVALMLPERWFVVGLAAFLSGHVAYVGALLAAPTEPAGIVAGLAIVAAAAAAVGRPIVAAVRGGPSPSLTGPVVAYIVVISAMVVSATGTLAATAVVGAGLFYLSDATLAWNRFVRPLAHGGLSVMVTYHLGQAGLVAWLVTG